MFAQRRANSPVYRRRTLAPALTPQRGRLATTRDKCPGMSRCPSEEKPVTGPGRIKEMGPGRKESAMSVGRRGRRAECRRSVYTGERQRAVGTAGAGRWRGRSAPGPFFPPGPSFRLGGHGPLSARGVLQTLQGRQWPTWRGPTRLPRACPWASVCICVHTCVCAHACLCRCECVTGPAPGVEGQDPSSPRPTGFCFPLSAPGVTYSLLPPPGPPAVEGQTCPQGHGGRLRGWATSWLSA